MTESTKEIFEKYEVRKTKAQKSNFIEFVKGYARENAYSCRVEESGGLNKPRNIVIGEPDTANVIYTAHYDTCPRLPFPNFITPKNIFIYILYQMIITLAFFAVSFIGGVLVGLLLVAFGVPDELAADIGSYAAYAVLILLLYLMMKGPANPHTANDNTSGVTVLLDTMKALPEELRGSVAFIFFDLEEVGLVGSSAFFAKHKKNMNDKLLLNFDCVSDGDHMLFVLKKQAAIYEDIIASSFAPDEKISVEIAKKGVFYPSDQAKFPLGVGVAALKKTKGGILYMNKIHTKHDTVYEEKNIEFLVKGSVALAEKMTVTVGYTPHH